MERAVPITGQSPPCYAPLDRGNKARGGPIRICAAGNPAQEKKTLSSPSALCPSAQAAEEPSRPSCAGIRMFLGGQTDFRPGACTEEVTQILTLERDSVRDQQ